MCCPLNQLNQRNLIIQTIELEKCENKQVKTLYFKGIYDCKPKTWVDSCLLFFQRLELLEKIAEIADECFHLFRSLFQHYTSFMVYQTLDNLHHAAHTIEHILHPFCLLNDITRLLTGKFLEYRNQESKKLDYLRTLSRIVHFVAHFFTTANFLNELNICSFTRLSKVFKYTSMLSALGYILWTISLIWQRHQKMMNRQFSSDIGIHLGGSVFETLSFAKTMNLSASYAFLLNKIGSIAGMIHAWFVIQRLMPKDREEFVAKFIVPDHCLHQHHKHSCC